MKRNVIRCSTATWHPFGTRTGRFVKEQNNVCGLAADMRGSASPRPDPVVGHRSRRSKRKQGGEETKVTTRARASSARFVIAKTFELNGGCLGQPPTRPGS